jgi:putative ABC transport system permease protein
MLRNYLKTAINSLLRSKFFSLVNILSLAIGMTVCLLIFMYIVNELSYEKFQKNRKDIFRLSLIWGSEDSKMKFAGSMPALAPAIISEVPEAEVAIRVRKGYDAVVKINNEEEFAEENLFFSDPEIFRIFSFSLVQGDPEHALEDPFSVVLSEKASRRYFGNASALGRELFYKDFPMKVTGIMDDIPANTHLRCDVIMSYTSLKAMGEDQDKPWNTWGDDFTYVLMKPGAAISTIIPKLDTLLLHNAGSWLSSRMQFDAQPLNRIHWETETRGDIGPKGNRSFIFIFLSAALFILTIACFNFLNLSLSRHIGRIKEAGIRKAMGASRKDLIIQFFTESLIVICISAVIAAYLFDSVYLKIYSYLGTEFVLGKGFLMTSFIILLIIILIVGLIAGGYPALYISRFSPMEVLTSGRIKHAERINLEKVLILLQFAISMILITGTIVIFHQISFMKNSDLGFDKKNVMLINFPGQSSTTGAKYETLRDELLKNTGIYSVSGAYTVPGINSQFNISVVPEGAKSEDAITMQALPADYGFVKTLGLEITDGRDFSKEFSSDRFGSVILNASAVIKLGLSKVLGTKLFIPGESYKNGVEVIGVIRDFHIKSFRENMGPLLIYINPQMYIQLIVKINPASVDNTINYIRSAWNEILPGIPFNFNYLENRYDNLYNSDKKAGQVLLVFAMLALFISCLGLFGIAVFIMNRRIKEIGIRKVMGAKVLTITRLLLMQFFLLILISYIIACPMAYLLSVKWLENFAFHVKLSWWVFVAASAIETIIAFVTVIFQTWRAASRNPVEALRYE